MGKEIIQTNKAPAAIGPYVQAVAVEEPVGFVFVSGQLGIDMSTGEMPESVAMQARHSLKNMGEILKAKEIKLDNVVKTVVYLTDMDDFAAVNEEYEKFFNGVNPARACIAVKALPKNAKVEIECIAYICN